MRFRGKIDFVLVPILPTSLKLSAPNSNFVTRTIVLDTKIRSTLQRFNQNAEQPITKFIRRILKQNKSSEVENK